MLQPCNSSRTLCGEQSDAQEEGVILLLGAIVLGVLLLLIAFVVDLGRLYHSRLELQKAADAGALAGMQASILQSDMLVAKSKAEMKSFLEQRAREVTRTNLLMNGITEFDADSDIRPVYDDSEDPNIALPRMTVDVRAEIPFILMSRLPSSLFGVESLGKSLVLAANAVTVRPVANIVLILDISKSMNCPADDEDCVCLTPRRTKTCEQVAEDNGWKLKIELLQDAVQEFTNRFNDKLDRISIIPFNIAADASTNDIANNVTDKKGVRFRPYQGTPTRADYGFNREDIANAIANLRPASNTNLSDGLIKAYLESKRVGLLGGAEEISYVVFSDGAPTAARFLFAPEGDPHGFGAGNNPDGIGTFDYTFYSLYWSVPSPDVAVESVTYPGPSPLMLSQFLKIDYDSPEPPKNDTGGSTVAPCSPEALQSDPTKYAQIMNVCLTNFRAHVPDDPGRTFGENFRPLSYDPNSGTAGLANLRVWEEAFYAATLQYADALRQRNGRFYVAGLGKPLFISDDPYQLKDAIAATTPLSAVNLLRKDVMLTRLANQRYDEYGVETTNPEFDYDGYQTIKELSDNPETKQGLYFPGTVASELGGIFDKIAGNILLRLAR